MARRGLVDVVATTDWDALAMGAPALLRNLSANPARTEGRAWTLVDAPHALGALGLTRERLAAAAVLMGCDYFPGFPRVGPRKAFKLACAEGPMEDAFAGALAALGATSAEREHAHAALRLLVDPPCVDCDLPRVLKGTTLDRFA
jgi:5'-3' exonuclease